jgi:hypothetical protein
MKWSKILFLASDGVGADHGAVGVVGVVGEEAGAVAFFTRTTATTWTSNAVKRNKHLTALGDCDVEYSSTLGYS